MPKTIAVRKAKEMMAASTLSLILSSIVASFAGMSRLSGAGVRRHNVGKLRMLRPEPSNLHVGLHNLPIQGVSQSRTLRLNNNSLHLDNRPTTFSLSNVLTKRSCNYIAGASNCSQMPTAENTRQDEEQVMLRDVAGESQRSSRPVPRHSPPHALTKRPAQRARRRLDMQQSRPWWPPAATKTRLGWKDARRSRPDGGRRRRRGQPLDRQLQGRPRHHRQGAGRAPLADDPGRRLRRQAPRRIRMEARRPGDAERLGLRRDASRRLCAGRPCQGRLAGAEAASSQPPRPWPSAPRGTPQCSRDGAGKAWRDTGRGPVVVTGAAGGVGSVAVALLAKLGYQVVASTGRATEADYLRAWVPPRSSTAPSFPARRGRSARNAGRAASMPSAATRWPTC